VRYGILRGETFRGCDFSNAKLMKARTSVKQCWKSQKQIMLNLLSMSHIRSPEDVFYEVHSQSQGAFAFLDVVVFIRHQLQSQSQAHSRLASRIHSSGLTRKRRREGAIRLSVRTKFF
jgi:uncharacterized protein (DUF1499 family)